MIGMKVRYEITDVNLKISNITPRDAEDSYVLLRVADVENEITFVFSHEQALHLEEELHEANRRWRMHASAAPTRPEYEMERNNPLSDNTDHISH